MEKFNRVVAFVFTNRRTIGLVIGGTLTLLGYADLGAFATEVGEI